MNTPPQFPVNYGQQGQQQEEESESDESSLPEYDFSDRRLYRGEREVINRHLASNWGMPPDQIPADATLYWVLDNWGWLTNDQTDTDELLPEYEALFGFPLGYRVVSPPNTPTGNGYGEYKSGCGCGCGCDCRCGRSCPLFR